MDFYKRTHSFDNSMLFTDELVFEELNCDGSFHVLEDCTRGLLNRLLRTDLFFFKKNQFFFSPRTFASNYARRSKPWQPKSKDLFAGDITSCDIIVLSSTFKRAVNWIFTAVFWNYLSIFCFKYWIHSSTKTMPYRCVVLNCQGNHNNGPKVHVFFRKDKELSDIWIRTIKREDFSPTMFSSE